MLKSWLSFALWPIGFKNKRRDFTKCDCDIQEFDDGDVCVTCGTVWDHGDAVPCNRVVIGERETARYGA